MPRISDRFDWAKIVFEMRMRSFLTQRELARQLGCVPATVGKWERGEAAPRPAALRALVAYGKGVGYPSEKWPQLGARR